MKKNDGIVTKNDGGRWELLRRNVRERLEDYRQIEDEELYEVIDEEIAGLGKEGFFPLPERLSLRERLFDSFRRLGILQEMMDRPDITEIMVNGRDRIFVERGGSISRWNGSFESEEQLEDTIQQIVSRVNRVVNVSDPIADARLPDGSRVHVVLPPVALDGPALTIRKFPEPITMKRLIELEALTEEAARFLGTLVEAGYNIFISGGTGSGKTTFLNALSAYIPADERIVTIEDSAELQIRQIPNLVRMETRNDNGEGNRPISVGDLIRASLRMRPDHALRVQHRPRRLSLHRPRQQHSGYAGPPGDHGAYGGGSAPGSHTEPDRVGHRRDGASGKAPGREQKSAGDCGDRRL